VTAQKDPYVRVYSSIITDERFATVYPDAAALGTWLQLLLVADGTYPAPAPIPRRVSDRNLGVLVDAGLIELCENDHYRIHGLEAEREKIRSSARVGGLARAKQMAEEAAKAAAGKPPNTGRSATADRPPSDAEPLRSAPLLSTPLRRARARGESGLSTVGEILPTVLERSN
jgi:hypothetical protein